MKATWRTWLAWGAALAAASAAAGGLWYAHSRGWLDPAYAWVQRLAHRGGAEQAGKDMPGMDMNMPGMDTGATPSPVPGYAEVTIPAEVQQRIGVRIGRVERGRLLMSVRAVGVIEPDQTRLAHIHTRINGWVTKVHVNFVGQDVKKGDPLLELYSPELFQTQSDYLLAVEDWESRGKAESQRQLVEAAKRRLELFGVPADEIQELEKTRKARETLRLRSPIAGRVLERNVKEGDYVEPAADLYRIADLSVVWLQAKVYEYELPHVEVDQPVRVEVPARPDLKVEGKVSFIEPVLQEATRTVKVRVPLDNARDQFKPGMYADLIIDHDMGEGLLVPESAVIRTGEQDVVFRAEPGGRFVPAAVRVGPLKYGGRFEALEGLKEGDLVSTSANFLIDSESRLQVSGGGMAGMPGMDMGGPKAADHSQMKDMQSMPAKEYPIQGRVTAVDPSKPSVKLDHEAIPGFMPAMEMEYAVEKAGLLEGVKAGDEVQGQLKVESGKRVITRLEKR
jgi:Cu(I)/Ag(I) efflux system membrane fusion protein